VGRLPLRARLVAGFVAVMVAVLTGAGAFVYWRVEVALDRTLNATLEEQASTVQQAWHTRPDVPTAATTALPPEALGQVLDAQGVVLSTTPAAAQLALLPAADRRAAASALIDVSAGNVLTGGNKRLRAIALPLTGKVGSPPRIAVVAVRLGQRDEALRERLAQLAAANALALAAAAVVGYRLARAALLPVERYRNQAEQIAAGAAGVRLDVPDGVDDEVSRLGHTLNRMLTEQERAAEQQRQFLADASHELRSPLTLLTSEVELALRRPRPAAEYEQTLQQVAQDTARLVVLADQLLSLEQATSAHSGRAPVNDAVLRAAARTRSQASERDVEVATGLPAQVAMSEVSLDQVLRNLTDNAVVHGAGTIALRTSSPGPVLLTVSDEGAGPPPEFVPHAVERFRRADPARTPPGNGLGLALVHALVSQAGGELRLCTGGGHHRYPPLVAGEVACAHPTRGTHVSVVLPNCP
jgi:two-component system OmpR family sensor kinase